MVYKVTRNECNWLNQPICYTRISEHQKKVSPAGQQFVEYCGTAHNSEKEILSKNSLVTSYVYVFKNVSVNRIPGDYSELGELTALWAPPVYPVFEDEKWDGSYEKSIKRKIALKTIRSNIILTNFV